MACRTGKVLVVGIVAAAVVKPVRLETDVVDSAEIGQDGDRVDAAMAGSAELLRQRFGIEGSRVEDERVGGAGRLRKHGQGMLFSRPVTGFAPDPGSHGAEIEFCAVNRRSRVTAEAVARFVAANVAAGGVFDTRCGVEFVADGPV